MIKTTENERYTEKIIETYRYSLEWVKFYMVISKILLKEQSFYVEF